MDRGAWKAIGPLGCKELDMTEETQLACMHACYLLTYDIYNPFIRFIVCCMSTYNPVKFHEGRGLFLFIFADLFQTPSTLPGTQYMFNKQTVNKILFSFADESLLQLRILIELFLSNSRQNRKTLYPRMRSLQERIIVTRKFCYHSRRGKMSQASPRILTVNFRICPYS